MLKQTNEALNGLNLGELIEPRFVVKALRSLGYTNYSALLDIIDNSIDAEATDVSINFETYREKERALISSILVCDNGIGMDYESLVSALHLGRDNGKDTSTNLGYYGAGLKTAAISIGTKFEIYTKTNEGELLKAVFDIKPLINGENSPCAKIVEITNDDINLFNEYCGNLVNNHGTIIRITNLDKLTCKNLFDFSGTLSNQISETYNKLIYNNVVNFSVNKKHCDFIDITGYICGYASILGENMISIDGYESPIIVKSYYIPGHIVTDPNKNIETLKRTKPNSGLFIYRNDRLVGKGLNWGIQNSGEKHTIFNGFRCEMFFLGEHDSLFGVSFSKMLTEGSYLQLPQEFRDKLLNTLKPLESVAHRRDQENSNKSNKTSEEDSIIYKSLEKVITDKRQLMGLKFTTPDNTGKKLNTNNGSKENKETEKRQSKSPILFKENFNLDERAMLWDIDRDGNGREIININANHPYYTDFFKELNDKQKQKFIALLASFGIAKTKCNYWLNEENSDLRNTIDKFEYEFSDALRTIMQNI